MFSQAIQHPVPPILLVDNDGASLSRTDALLRAAGLKPILTCRDNRRVLALLAEQRIRLVFLDLPMTLGSKALLVAITRDYPAIPVIVATQDMATTAWCIEQGGAFECAVKPAEPDCLIALVEKALALPMIRQEDSPPKHHTYPAWFSQLSLKMTTDEAALIQFSALLPTLRQAIDLLIQEALRRTHGRQSSAARLLGISQQALSKRLKNRI